MSSIGIFFSEICPVGIDKYIYTSYDATQIALKYLHDGIPSGANFEHKNH